MVVEPATILAAELVRLARELEPLNGAGRYAAVWRMGAPPKLLYSGPEADSAILTAATERLSAGEKTFELDAGPGARGKVVVCGDAAYGLFLTGAGHPHVETTVDGLMAEVERASGKSVGAMTRVEKQAVVRFLDERGVFLIRKAVEDVAARLGVSRFTVYNYLDRED